MRKTTQFPHVLNHMRNVLGALTLRDICIAYRSVVACESKRVVYDTGMRFMKCSAK